jgi:hypothetical protein
MLPLGVPSEEALVRAGLALFEKCGGSKALPCTRIALGAQNFVDVPRGGGIVGFFGQKRKKGEEEIESPRKGGEVQVEAEKGGETVGGLRREAKGEIEGFFEPKRMARGEGGAEGIRREEGGVGVEFERDVPVIEAADAPIEALGMGGGVEGREAAVQECPVQQCGKCGQRVPAAEMQVSRALHVGLGCVTLWTLGYQPWEIEVQLMIGRLSELALCRGRGRDRSTWTSTWPRSCRRNTVGPMVNRVVLVRRQIGDMRL